jgi:predicted enzyme related to lactoylglutathione lyase
MARRDTPPIGAPCWVDLLTSDTGRSRAFYTDLFGWTAEEPNPDFGGYFNFAKDGIRVAGGMSRQGDDMPDAWFVYLTTDDARKTADAAVANGGQIIVEPMAVADLGTMAMVTDPTGAATGMWQPGQHKGFGIVTETGAPSWFELATRDYPTAVAFYRGVFRWDTHTVSDTPGFRYTTLRHGDDQLAGIMDASGFLPEGVPSHWWCTSASTTPTRLFPGSPGSAAASSARPRTRPTGGWRRRATPPAPCSSSSRPTRRCRPADRRPTGRAGRPVVPSAAVTA